MDPRDQYRALDVYMGAYLYESWSQDYASPDDALAEFLTEADPVMLSAFVAEAQTVLALSDKGLHEVLARLSPNFGPRSDYGWDDREWMVRLRDRAAEELSRRS